MTDKTKYKSYIEYIQNHKWLSLIVLIGAVIIGIGTFTDSITKIKKAIFDSPRTGTANVTLTITPKEFFSIVSASLERDVYNHEKQKYEHIKPSPEDVKHYISYMAKESENLANAWEDVVEGFTTGLITKDENLRRGLRIKYGVSPNANEPHYSRLLEFYSLLKKEGYSIGPSWLRKISWSTESILFGREISVEKLNELVADLQDPLFFHKENSLNKIQSLSDSVDLLKREAAALHAISNLINESNYKN